MKSKTLTVFLFIFALMITATAIADANVFGSIKDYIAANAWASLVSGIFALLGVFFGVKATKWRSVAVEAVDLVQAIRSAIDAKGPGGKSITKEEMDKIIDEATQEGTALAGVLLPGLKLVK